MCVVPIRVCLCGSVLVFACVSSHPHLYFLFPGSSIRLSPFSFHSFSFISVLFLKGQLTQYMWIDSTPHTHKSGPGAHALSRAGAWGHTYMNMKNLTSSSALAFFLCKRVWIFFFFFLRKAWSVIAWLCCLSLSLSLAFTAIQRIEDTVYSPSAVVFSDILSDGMRQWRFGGGIKVKVCLAFEFINGKRQSGWNNGFSIQGWLRKVRRRAERMGAPKNMWIDAKCSSSNKFHCVSEGNSSSGKVD